MAKRKGTGGVVAAAGCFVLLYWGAVITLLILACIGLAKVVL